MKTEQKLLQKVLEILSAQLLPFLFFGFFPSKNVRTAVLRVLTVETGREEKDMEGRFVVESFILFLFFFTFNKKP